MIKRIVKLLITCNHNKNTLKRTRLKYPRWTHNKINQSLTWKNQAGSDRVNLTCSILWRLRRMPWCTNSRRAGCLISFWTWYGRFRVPLVYDVITMHSAPVSTLNAFLLLTTCAECSESSTSTISISCSSLNPKWGLCSCM